MDFASSTRTAEDKTRWRGIAAKSSVVPQRPCKIMGQTRLDRTHGNFLTLTTKFRILPH